MFGKIKIDTLKNYFVPEAIKSTKQECCLWVFVKKIFNAIAALFSFNASSTKKNRSYSLHSPIGNQNSVKTHPLDALLKPMQLEERSTKVSQLSNQYYKELAAELNKENNENKQLEILNNLLTLRKYGKTKCPDELIDSLHNKFSDSNVSKDVQNNLSNLIGYEAVLDSPLK